MKLEEFDYILPSELIAQKPVEPRDSSKLMILDPKSWNIKDKNFRDIIDYLGEDDVLVVNKTRVIKARLKWDLEWKNIEIFLHKQIDSNTWDCLVYPGKKLKPWKKIFFEKENIKLSADILSISNKWRIVKFDSYGEDFFQVLNVLWEIPLPPYIKEKSDDNRYQTVYNDEIGWSVAAPTAGLHFTEELIEKLQQKWVIIEKVLLHVGLWTFMNVETEEIEEHQMHSEYISLEKDTSERLNEYKKQGKNIIAVWTTSIRVLESFSTSHGVLEYGSKDTNIFIYPWYNWKFVDSLITNFHLPKSTLLMLVSSLAWKEHIKNAYRHAIDNNYRFFSFWDAMRIQ